MYQFVYISEKVSLKTKYEMISQSITVNRYICWYC